MRALVIAVGNRLRGDDGVGHAVLERLAAAGEVESRALIQLTPELAADMAPYDTVVFVDADSSALNLSVEPLSEAPAAPAFTHIAGPAEIVALSRALFGFAGQVFLCRIPAIDFSPGEGLSPQAGALVDQAAAQVQALFADRTCWKRP